MEDFDFLRKGVYNIIISCGVVDAKVEMTIRVHHRDWGRLQEKGRKRSHGFDSCHMGDFYFVVMKY